MNTGQSQEPRWNVIDQAQCRTCFSTMAIAAALSWLAACAAHLDAPAPAASTAASEDPCVEAAQLAWSEAVDRYCEELWGDEYGECVETHASPAGGQAQAECEAARRNEAQRREAERIEERAELEE